MALIPSKDCDLEIADEAPGHVRDGSQSSPQDFPRHGVVVNGGRESDRVTHAIQQTRQPEFEAFPIALEQSCPPLRGEVTSMPAEKRFDDHAGDQPIWMGERRKQADGSARMAATKPPHRNQKYSSCIGRSHAPRVVAKCFQAGPLLAMRTGSRRRNTFLKFARDVFLDRGLAAQNELHIPNKALFEQAADVPSSLVPFEI